MNKDELEFLVNYQSYEKMRNETNNELDEEKTFISNTCSLIYSWLKLKLLVKIINHNQVELGSQSKYLTPSFSLTSSLTLDY